MAFRPRRGCVFIMTTWNDYRKRNPLGVSENHWQLSQNEGSTEAKTELRPDSCRKKLRFGGTRKISRKSPCLWPTGVLNHLCFVFFASSFHFSFSFHISWFLVHASISKFLEFVRARGRPWDANLSQSLLPRTLRISVALTKVFEVFEQTDNYQQNMFLGASNRTPQNRESDHPWSLKDRFVVDYPPHSRGAGRFRPHHDY